MDEATGQEPTDPIEQLVEYLEPVLLEILARVDAEEFTTAQFIEILQTDPDGDVAYHEALRRWGENERYAKMVVHGQVIPLILRRSDRVEWAGYAHGEEDAYGVAAWWTVRSG